MQKHAAIQELFGHVAEQLVADSVVEMIHESGRSIEVWTIGRSLATVHASAPEGSVPAGTLLTCGIALGGCRRAVTVRAAESVERPGSRDSLRLKVVGANMDDTDPL